MAKIVKPLLMKVSLTKVPGWDARFVEVDGIKRGVIRPVNRGWVAERMGCYKTNDPANVHGWFGSQQGAIDAIVTASIGQPPNIVYPEQSEEVKSNWNALGLRNA